MSAEQEDAGSEDAFVPGKRSLSLRHALRRTRGGEIIFRQRHLMWQEINAKI